MDFENPKATHLKTKKKTIKPSKKPVSGWKQRMRFEHRSQQVIPLSTFFIRLFRYGLFALMLIAFSVFIGIFGYHFIGKLGWIDSFHMASMILTGMGPVAEMKEDSAKLFSSFYALYSGVAFLTIIAVFFAPIVHRFLHVLHVEDDNEPDELKKK